MSIIGVIEIMERENTRTKLISAHFPRAFVDISAVLFCVGMMCFLPARACAQVTGAEIGLAGAEVGQEIRQAEKQILGSGRRSPKRKPAITLNEPKKLEREAREAKWPPPGRSPAKERERPGEAVAGKKFKIWTLAVTGDGDLLDIANVRRRFEFDVVGKTLTIEQIKNIAAEHKKLLVDKGYYLVRLKAVDWTKGVLIYDIDKGRFGKMYFREAERIIGGIDVLTVDPAGEIVRDTTRRQYPFSGRYFSEEQLRRKMVHLKEGEVFDYNEFYRAVFSINTSPDITMDVALNVVEEEVRGRRMRYADMAFTVREDVGLHGFIEVKNTGTESTEEWRIGTTLQHLNLTQHDDVLTVNLSAASDVSSLLSVALSYYYPFYYGKGSALNVYGGYSRIDANDVAPGLDVEGVGWFAGLQRSYKLISTKKHLFSSYLGVVYRAIEHNLVFHDEAAPAAKVTIVPVSVAFSYASARPDHRGGKTFMTARTSFNVSGSEDDELQDMRADAEADYHIETLQLARIQPLFGRVTGRGARVGQWILFIKLDGQFASGELIPAEQQAVGGVDTVRGYIERAIKGDSGVSGTLELRTPLLQRVSRSQRYPSSFGYQEEMDTGSVIERTQFVAFVDGGYVASDNPQLGDEETQSIGSAGLGVRLTFSRFAQLKFDWGFPFTEMEASPASGRGHLQFQVRF